MDNYFQEILNEYTQSQTQSQVNAIRKKEGIAFNTSKGHPTQRTSTTATYLKFYKLLTPEEQKGEGLDYSAGLGKGSALLRQEFDANIESYEPFPHEDSEDITYVGLNSLPDKLYDYIFCSAVLNVVEQDIRNFIVQDIFAHLKPGGEAIIGVRSKADVLSARTAYVIDAENGEIIDRVRGSYQKGFTGPELREYISTILPEASVTRVEVSGFSQIVVRVAKSEWDAYKDLTEAIGTLKYSARRDREGGLMVVAYDTTRQDINGEPLCIAHLHVPAERIRWNRFSVGDVNVAKEYRRQGIATKMYELAEKKLKIKASPSEIRSPDAIEFWKKRDI
jgi:GNAT superfamily N-acetyltransferase